MCGLYGYITNKNTTLTQEQQTIRNNIIRGLAIFMQERGVHSTGVAGIYGKNQTQIYKKAIPARDFTFLQGYKEFMEKNNSMVIGHTRAATVGAKTDENAHPFKKGSIVGAHNGRVENWLDIYREADVDSEAIFYLLDQTNNDFEKTFSELKGKFAITWFEENSPTKVHFMINGNPLFLVRIHELETYFWCSTLHALQAIVGSYFPLKYRHFWAPLINTVYSLDNEFIIDKKSIQLKSDIITPAPTTILKPKEKSLELPSGNYKFKQPTLEEALRIQHEREKTKMNSRDLQLFSNLMNLNFEEMRLIIRLAHQDVCMFCQTNIDLEEGFWYYKIGKQLICPKCADVVQDFGSMVFVGKFEFEDIEEEVIEELQHSECDDYEGPLIH